MIRHTVSQTPDGITAGSIIETLPFKQIDGNNFPVFKAVVMSISFVDFQDGITFYSIIAKCKKNPLKWHILHIDSKHVKKL